jgi:transcriptional regulator with XRE-family HTH domain
LRYASSQAVRAGTLAALTKEPKKVTTAKTAERLKSLRAQRGLSQADVAAAISHAQSTVSDWEIERSEPSATALLRLSHLLGASVDYIVGATDHPLNLRPGDWIVDLDVFDGLLAGKKFDDGEGLAAPIPPRFRIVTSTDYVQLRKQLRERLKGKAT